MNHGAPTQATDPLAPPAETNSSDVDSFDANFVRRSKFHFYVLMRLVKLFTYVMSVLAGLVVGLIGITLCCMVPELRELEKDHPLGYIVGGLSVSAAFMTYILIRTYVSPDGLPRKAA